MIIIEIQRGRVQELETALEMYSARVIECIIIQGGLMALNTVESDFNGEELRQKLFNDGFGGFDVFDPDAEALIGLASRAVKKF